jgi:NCS2 family nucleobase:cation symporter-2
LAAQIGAGFLARTFDRRTTRPAGIVYWLDEVPPLAPAIALALQHLAIQSIYFVIPAVLAGSLSRDPADAGRFIGLSILASALWQALQLLARGPIGSGYPIPGTHTAALVGAYALAGAAGISFGGVGAMLIVTGVACVLLTFVMHRLRLVLPNEVAGVVVFLIGVALVVLATQRLGLQPGGELPDVTRVLAVFVSLAIMALVALSRTRAAPLAVLIGALVGVPLSLWLGHGYPDAAALVDARPWIAIPEPWTPRFGEISLVPMLAFLVAIVALKATAMGSMVVIQKGSDASWSRPDAPPVRRGLLANGIAIVAAGTIGAACPAPATAAVGLSVATGTLARRIAWIGAGMLLVAALCPKLTMLFVVLPEPIKAAMLFYIAGFIMAQSCQLVTARLLDTRRTLIVSVGLCAGIAVAVAPQAFILAVPVLASPLAVGAMSSFLMNLVTLPLVTRSSAITVPLDGSGVPAISDWFRAVAGTWALKPQTEVVAEQSICELADLLTERGTGSLALAARLAEDRVEITLRFPGAPLPDPPKYATPHDLLGSDQERHRFAVWLATRHAHGFRQRAIGGENELWLAFED